MATAFTLFPNLPAEIRLRIWRHTFPGPRIIVTLRKTDIYIFAPDISHLPPVLAMSVCYESREEAKKRYNCHLTFHPQSVIPRPMLHSSHYPRIETDSSIDVWVDPDNDPVYIGLEPEALGHAISKLKYVITPEWYTSPVLFPLFSEAHIIIIRGWKHTRLLPGQATRLGELTREVQGRIPGWEAPVVCMQDALSGGCWRCIPESDDHVPMDLSEGPFYQLASTR